MNRRSPARAGSLVLVAVLAAAAPRSASAESAADVDTARAFFIEATKLGHEGRWKEARELYARSLLLKPAPITHYSLGVAQKETGQFARALGSFRSFVSEPTTPATAPYAEPARAAVAELEGRIGRVTITVEPRPIEGLTLAIDGEPAPPALDRAREIDPGTHEVVARAPGFRGAITRFSVAAGGGAAVAIVLTRLTKVGAAQATPGPAAGLPPLADSAAPLDPPAAPVSPDRTLPIALMASGGALFAVGLTVGLVGVRQASLAVTKDGADAAAARAKGIAGDVIGGVGIATAGVGLVLFLTQRRASPPAAGAARPSMSASGAGLGLSF